MAVYEIANPSDAYTIEHEDESVACAATLLLGEGHYGLTREDGDRTLPIFIFGGAAAWLESRGMMPFGDWINAHLVAIADALDSVTIGGFEERRKLAAKLATFAPEEREGIRQAHHDRKRSSLNNIGAWARNYAEVLRGKAAAQPIGEAS